MSAENIALALDKLGLGLSRLLRYSYGGFLLIAIASLLNPSGTKTTLDAMSWQLAAISAVILGAGIYAVHRSVVIPIHHALLCLIFRGWDWWNGIEAEASSSPTRWLSSIGMRLGQRMLAYSALRGSDLFTEKEERDLNVEHAEAGLVVLTAEGLVAGAIYASLFESNIGWSILITLALVALGASFPGPFILHGRECQSFRNNVEEAKKILKERGFSFESQGENREQKGDPIHQPEMPPLK